MNEFHEEDEEFFCRFTFGQFVSLALLEVVALFFVFYLGTRYGPGILGRNDSAELAPQAPAQVEQVYDSDRGEPADVKYTYPEVLTRKKSSAIPAPQPMPVKKKALNPNGLTMRGAYSVQVGSFRQASGAAEKVNYWQGRGYDAFLSIGEVANSGTWYRVRLGSFRTRDSARRFLEQVKKKERVKGIIVRSSS